MPDLVLPVAVDAPPERVWAALTDDVDEVVGVIQAAEAARVAGDGGGGMRAPLVTGPSDA